MHGTKFVSIDVNWFNASSMPLLGIQMREARALYQEAREDVVWAGVASQYFCTIVTAEKTKGTSAAATRFDTRRLNEVPVYGIQGAVGMPGFQLTPGQSLEESFEIYAGPKDLSQLRKLGRGQEAVMNFGMFGFVSEVPALDDEQASTGLSQLRGGNNHPHHHHQNTSLADPEPSDESIEEDVAPYAEDDGTAREATRDDPQKMNEEVMKLYREYGVNPFSGCVPMLIQIPIFFGFYAMLGSAIELRNSSFLWVQDLSQPDTVFRIWGFPVNVAADRHGRFDDLADGHYRRKAATRCSKGSSTSCQ